jgi:hypothetical protein
VRRRTGGIVAQRSIWLDQVYPETRGDPSTNGNGPPLAPSFREGAVENRSGEELVQEDGYADRRAP